LVVDLAANSNNGSGSLYIKQLFDGSGNPVNDVFHAADPSLLNVNLGIQRMATVSGGAPYAADPANWNGMMVRTAGNGGLDNISISTDALTGSPQWALNAAGNWANGANWYPAVTPNGVDAAASFGGIISSDHTIYSDTPVTVGTLHISNSNTYVLTGAGTLTLQTSTGSALVDVQAGTQKINLPLIVASDTTLNVVSGATLKISNPVTINAGKSVTQTGAGTVLYESTVTVQSGANLTLGGSSHIAALSVASTGSASLAAGNNKTLRADSLSVSGRLDLRDNRLITPAAVGSWNGSNYTGVTGLVKSGRNGGGWGGNGIVTSQTDATGGNYTSIGVAQASDVRPATATATALWNGQTITGTDTLVMYTYGGDATLDGKINIDDYVKIDSGISAGLTGWVNGDFNYDGKVSIDDYITVIDANIGNQNGALGTASGESLSGSGVSAVPEPSLCFVSFGAASLLKLQRRRRRRK
jgi:hypothetical protein